MKSCPYCGETYPDEASICVMDRQPLQPAIAPQTAPGAEGKNSKLGLILLTSSVAVGCLLIGLIWYWQTHLTYNGEVSRFEARVRKQVDPVKLQGWATELISLHSTSQVAEASFPIAAFPDYLRNLHKLPPFGFVFPAAPERPGYVRVTWGSGFRGHWGLNVGSTNFVDPYGDNSERWQPGVYLWRAYRP